MKNKLLISILSIFTFSNLSAMKVTDEGLPDPKTPDDLRDSRTFPPDMTPDHPSSTIRSTDIHGRAGSGAKVKKDVKAGQKKKVPIRDAE